MKRRVGFVTRCALVVTLGIIAASCSGVTPRPTVTSEPNSVPKARTADTDRALKIGVLLPTSGSGQELSPPLLRGIDLAIQEINDAGGVFGRPVTIIRRDEGNSVATASLALDQFFVVDAVDAIVGPASSRIALGLRDRLTSNQMPTCSPLATASALSSSSDNGFFFRTIPSDSLQATAIASAIERTGGRTTTLVVPDDDYGTSFAQNLRSELARRGLSVPTVVVYDPAASSYRDVAARVLTGAQPDTVALIGTGTSGANVLTALRTSGASKTSIIVNDALRRVGTNGKPNANPNWLNGVEGVAPLSAAGSPDWQKRYRALALGTPNTFAAYAYDCVNLIALAAVASNSENPSKLAGAMIPTSRGGVTCSTFKECSDALADKRNIDLVGASGSLDLDPSGDVSSGTFDDFTFDPATGGNVLKSSPIFVG